MQLVNVVLNAIFRQKIKSPNNELNELISVLIPARNEEKNIAFLLSDLQNTKFSNLEIIVFDDESTDNTSKIIEKFAKQDNRISMIRSKGLPSGWLGKTYACYQLAQKASGQYLLFLDADTRINGNIIPKTVAYLKKHQLKLLSVFPVQIQKSFGEKISVPVMNYILLTLLPLIFVRVSPFASHAAANGQFMLFDADTYKQLQPHQLFKDFAAEDIAIARFYKRMKLKIACITGEKNIQCRMYQSYNEAIHGFSKNVFMFFGNMPVLALLFWIFSTLGFIPVLLAYPQYLLVYFLVLLLIVILYSFVSMQNIGLNILLFPFQMFFLLSIIVNAFLTRKKKTLKWKERNIY
ncbi:MAG: glycosyltransferase family 2 protein [Candidatus Kapaibacteriales bacterium]